jgi:hypothetical protein
MTDSYKPNEALRLIGQKLRQHMSDSIESFAGLNDLLERLEEAERRTPEKTGCSTPPNGRSR